MVSVKSCVSILLCECVCTRVDPIPYLLLVRINTTVISLCITMQCGHLLQNFHSIIKIQTITIAGHSRLSHVWL